MKLKDIIKFLKYYFQKEKKLFYLSSTFLFINSLVGMLYGFLIGLAIDKISLGLYKEGIWFFLIIWLISLLNNFIFDRLGKLCMSRFCNNIVERIGYDVYEKVGLLPAYAFEEKTSGELINRISNDTSTITDTFREMLHLVVSLFTSLIVFIYILFNSLIVALEIIIYLIAFYLVSKKYLPFIRKKQREITIKKDAATSWINETVRGIREIRALGIRKKTNKRFKKIIHDTFNDMNKQVLYERNYRCFVVNINVTLEFVVFLTCIILLMNGTSSYAFFMTMTYYIYRFMGTVEDIMDLSTSFEKMKVSLERINEILGNKLYSDEVYGHLNNTEIIGNIEFKDVTFKYPNEEKDTLKNFNLLLPTGKKIAIVGKSGQGKTTIFNLILRYFNPDKGNIYLDGNNLNDYTEDAFRKNIAIIRQDPFIFNKTIKENLTMINDKISLEEIRKACKLAEIDEYIMSLPNRYDTLIGEGGINLSGGQKQRLAIARALLKDSKIILFDEATSALDNENQRKIKKCIDNLVKKHTIIIVAHRLSTIVDADIIYLIDKGKVAAIGTHKELITNNKIYQKLYQSEG